MYLSNERKIIIAGVVLTLIGLVFFLFNETKPKPGTKLEDLGREHIPIGTEITYNSNPPTSGNHYEVWTTAGVYDTPKDDRNLVHSLEHGYVIMSYNCSFKQSFLIKPVLAQSSDQTLPPDTSPSASLSPEFSSTSCQDLVTKLTDIYNNKGKRKLIVVPRPNLDSVIALTAWTYIEKFNDFDKSRIEKFIDAHRDHGPEQTME